ncbi:MAG: peptide/nickel transport system substrate-binding protein [Rhodospirillaceae bacterium]|jgi:peptide/nickel transport system substrate-binding protein|nr:peptide/nickel transport system substrate-binding protein [Rhodospirillaceae bacterium]
MREKKQATSFLCSDASTSAQVGRREFMAQMAGTAALGLLASSARPSPGFAAETPRKGGHLIVGTDGASTSDSLDPATYLGAFLPLVGLQLHDTLTDVDANGKLLPQLAESWDAKAGAKEWVFKIRKGVTFHDGKAMTAADVVYSLNLHRGKDSKSAAKAYLTAVSDIKATGPNEVTIVLESGNADLPYIMTDYHLCIIPDGAKPAAGVGTGPFIFESFEPGIRARTKRNPNDWQTERGFVDSVETLAINDPVARASALLSGTIHLMNRMDPKTAGRLTQNANLELFNISAAAHYCFPMRCDTAPFNNNDVRLALKYAIDREALVKTVLMGYGKVANDQPIASFDPSFAADIPQRNYDPDKARFHIKKSGHDGPIALHVSEGAFSGAVSAAEVFQSSAAKAGIKIQIAREPADGYWSNVWMKQPFCASFWSGRPTADLMFSIAYKSDAPWNESFWKHPKFDEVLVAARAELDRSKRQQMYRDLQLMVHDDGGELIPMFNNFLDGGTKRLKGFKPMPAYELSGYRAPAQVWLES